MEKLPLTETLDVCIDRLANIKRLEIISRNHLQSRKKLEPEMEKQLLTEALEMCINQCANMERLEIISRNHFNPERN